MHIPGLCMSRVMRLSLVLVLWMLLPAVLWSQTDTAQNGTQQNGTQQGGRVQRTEAGALYTIDSVVYLPTEYFVGDSVEVRIAVRVAPETEVTPPADLPDLDWADIHSVRVLDRLTDFEVRIELTPFAPGTQSLPTLDMGDVVLEGVDLRVSSILASEDEVLRQVRGQVLLPTTRIVIAVLIGLLIAIPVFWLVFVRWGSKQIESLVAWRREGKPLRRFVRNYRELHRNIAELSARDFYSRLLHDLRRYISDRTSRDCMSYTTREMKYEISRLSPEPAMRTSLEELFEHGDLVKFASLASSVTDRDTRLEHALETIQSIDSDYRRRKKTLSRKRKPLRKERVHVDG